MVGESPVDNVVQPIIASLLDADGHVILTKEITVFYSINALVRLINREHFELDWHTIQITVKKVEYA